MMETNGIMGIGVMKKLVLICLGLSLLWGCASVDEEAVVRRKVFEAEKRIGEEMIEAFRKRDFERFVRRFPSGGHGKYGREQFEQEQREAASRLGEIVSYRFLTQLELEPAHHLVWAVRFESRTLKGDPIYREAIFSIVVGEVDGQRRVFLFGFQ